jgi:hypothetical protein
MEPALRKTYVNLIFQDVRGLSHEKEEELINRLNKMNKKREKNTHSQTSRLENPKGLQLHHNHEKFLFLTVLLLFAQYKMYYW